MNPHGYSSFRSDASLMDLALTGSAREPMDTHDHEQTLGSSSQSQPQNIGAVVHQFDKKLFHIGLVEHARYLGMDPDTEPEYLWIAKESLVAPVPDGWEQVSTTGGSYYYNRETEMSCWEHPMDAHYRELYLEAKKEAETNGHAAGTSYESHGGEDSEHVNVWSSYDSTANNYGGEDIHHSHDSQYKETYQNVSYWEDGHQPEVEVSYSSLPGSEGGKEAYEAYQEVATHENGWHEQNTSWDGHGDVYGEGTDSFNKSSAAYNGENAHEGGSSDSSHYSVHSDADGKTEDVGRTGQYNASSPYGDETGCGSRSSRSIAEEKEVDALKNLLLEQQQANKELENEKSELQGRIEKTVKEKELHRKRSMKLSKEMEGLVKEKTRLEEEVNELQVLTGRDGATPSEERYEKQKSSLEGELVHVQNAVQDIQAKLDAANEELVSKKKTIKELKKLLSEREEAFKEHTQSASLTTETVSNELEYYKKEALEVQRKCDAVETELAAMKTKLADVEKHKERQEKEDEDRVHDQLLSLQEQLEALALERDTISEQKAGLEEKMEEDKASHDKELTEADGELRAAKREIRSLEREINQLQLKNTEKEEELERKSKLMADMEAEMSERDRMMEEKILKAREEGVMEARAEMEEAMDAIRAEKDRHIELYMKEMKLRRQLHNRIMELQGNIRVFCRVRPIQPVEEQTDQAVQAVEFSQQDTQSLVLTVGDQGDRGGQKNVFEFDHVFQPTSTQGEVFNETKALVISAMDGYNVCIFAYGQTGSGKTFTMEGPKDNRGVNFRAMQELFRVRSVREETGQFQCKMKVSMLEVYNESIVDLLAETKNRGTLDVRTGKQGSYVENLIDVEVFNEADVSEIMTLGHSHRSVGAHNANEHSSRSHLVMCVTIETSDRASGKKTFSKLNLIDLAGSERLSKTAASGQRLKEAQNINRSLSALGDVISALGSSSKHVPYRNSKLTFLLQDSLSGNSKVLMFVNISPVQWNAWESMCSLNFASRCRMVALGQAKSNTSNGASSANLRSKSSASGASFRGSPSK